MCQALRDLNYYANHLKIWQVFEFCPAGDPKLSPCPIMPDTLLVQLAYCGFKWKIFLKPICNTAFGFFDEIYKKSIATNQRKHCFSDMCKA